MSYPKKPQGFMLFLEHQELFSLLTHEEVGRIVMALFDYSFHGVIPTFNERALSVAFKSIQLSIDRNKKSYEEMCESNRKKAKVRWAKAENGNSGRADEMPQEATAYDSMPRHTSVSENMPQHASASEDMPHDSLECEKMPLNEKLCLNNSNNNNNDISNYNPNDEEISKETDNIELSFEKIYELYDRPGGDLKKLRGQWGRFPLAERKVIREYILKYKDKTPNPEYRKKFKKFLDEETWKNEPIQDEINKPFLVESSNDINANIECQATDRDIEMWKTFLAIIKSDVSEREFETWFKCLQVISFQENMLTICAPSEFVIENLESSFLDKMGKALKESFGSDALLSYMIGVVSHPSI